MTTRKTKARSTKTNRALLRQRRRAGDDVLATRDEADALQLRVNHSLACRRRWWG